MVAIKPAQVMSFKFKMPSILFKQNYLEELAKSF